MVNNSRWADSSGTAAATCIFCNQTSSYIAAYSKQGKYTLHSFPIESNIKKLDQGDQGEGVNMIIKKGSTYCISATGYSQNKIQCWAAMLATSNSRAVYTYYPGMCCGFFQKFFKRSEIWYTEI